MSEEKIYKYSVDHHADSLFSWRVSFRSGRRPPIPFFVFAFGMLFGLVTQPDACAKGEVRKSA